MSIEPTTIGRYRVLGELGQGAMGIVYLAEDPLLKRGIAIKVMKPGAMSPEEALNRFRREAEVSAKLNHPNIITIHDVGDEPGFGPFLAMEHLQGTSLAAWLQGTPREADAILRLLLQGMHGLEAAHAAGIVHRDIKPDNLMVTHQGRLKLMDFGIARADDAAYITTTALLCTPGYAAPELLDGKAPSEATDRWAFVVTTFQCLAGTLPWEAETLSGMLYHVAHSDPKFPEGLDPNVRAVFQKALAKKPEDRFPTLGAFMAELIEALPLFPEQRAQLQALAGAQEVSGTFAPVAPGQRPTGAPGTGELPRRRRLPKFALMAGLLLLGAGGLGLAYTRFSGRSLSLYSRPEGAKVFVDGAYLGTTPMEKARVPRKAALLRAEKPGFLPYEHPLEPGDEALRFLLMPEPVMAAVRSDPAGAEVFLDGVLKGLTPMERLAIPAEGTHALFVRKKGYEPWAGNLSGGGPIPDPIPLRPIPEVAAPRPLPSRGRALRTSTPGAWTGEDPNATAAPSGEPKPATRPVGTAPGAQKPGKFKSFFRKLFRKDTPQPAPKAEGR